MLGISTSIFSETGSLMKDWLRNPLNASFFYWYFLPAAGFVLLHILFVGPALGYPAPPLFNVEVGHPNTVADLILQILNARFIKLILLPLVLGVVLSSLAGTVLRLFQGTLPITRPVFRSLLKRNQKRSDELYGPLKDLRRKYFFLVAQGNDEPNEEPSANSERETLIEQLKQEIQAQHERLEATSSARDLPVESERVGPTSLANILARAEEYPFERYSIDTAVFWPRLAPELEPEKLDSLSASFGMMNGLLNLSLLSYLFACESLILSGGMLIGLIRTAWTPIISAVVGILLGLAAYRAALGAARSVGNSLRAAFDCYRDRLLHSFNLKMPDDIERERVVWLKLGAFIRRGESFYYPSEFRKTP
jgi:hypothetical protein